jgi:hypothetical protein
LRKDATDRRAGRATALALTAALLAAAIGAPAANTKLPEDDPLPPAETGCIRGRVLPAHQVAELSAVSRVAGRQVRPERFDKQTGRFAFEELPGDATYDLVVRTADGRRYEGIDLSFVDARLLRLAERRREKLGLPPARTYAFGPRDAKEIVDWIEGAAKRDFLELSRVLYVKGDGPRATVLLERMRTRPDYTGVALYIWRVELWYFAEQFGGWQKLDNQARMLRRERLPAAQWRKLHVEYLPELSVFISRDGRSEPVEFRIPKAPDASRGRLPGTDPDIDTKPNVLGLDVKPPTTQPTTAPSAIPAAAAL